MAGRIKWLEECGAKTEIRIGGTMGRMATLHQGWEGDGRDFSSQVKLWAEELRPNFLIFLKVKTNKPF